MNKSRLNDLGRGSLARVALAAAMLLPQAVVSAHNGLAWTLEQVSPGISHKGLSTAQVFRAPQPVPAGATITSVRGQREARGNGYLATTLCTGPGVGRCVVVTGSHTRTDAFNGLPANQEFYLTHTIMGEGPQTPPMFVKASVTVWYQLPR